MHPKTPPVHPLPSVILFRTAPVPRIVPDDTEDEAFLPGAAPDALGSAPTFEQSQAILHRPPQASEQREGMLQVLQHITEASMPSDADDAESEIDADDATLEFILHPTKP